MFKSLKDPLSPLRIALCALGKMACSTFLYALAGAVIVGVVGGTIFSVVALVSLLPVPYPGYIGAAVVMLLAAAYVGFFVWMLGGVVKDSFKRYKRQCQYDAEFKLTGKPPPVGYGRKRYDF